MQSLFILPILPAIPVWLWWIIAPGSLGPIITLLLALIPNKASSIAILGGKKVGKTTLWHRLGGLENAAPDTSFKTVPEFEVERPNGNIVNIKQQYDIGGEDDYVGEYGRLIKPNTFIFYLVDSTIIDSNEYIKRIRSDLKKIGIVINRLCKDKNLKCKPKDFGFKILLTKIDKVELPVEEVIINFCKQVKSAKLANNILSRIDGEEGNNGIIAVNFLDDRDIDKIKEVIGIKEDE